ncbi:TonB-dependent receptor [Nafulsella turpanensis]|uniref:TonB-dependent receptor n=1 Tax=Nafulsella turpanensis TaxID=1265690 RepID=UPI000349018A|nr:TonB-dependent receptor [Nafulsella turpanensis]
MDRIFGFQPLSFIFFLTFLLPFTFLQAQTAPCVANCECELTGKIVDRLSGEPLAFASVLVKGTDNGTYSDENGVFHLHGLCTDEFDLVISYVGYKPLTHHHDIYHQAPVIYLSPANFQLESVVIEGARIESGQLSLTESRISPEDLENSGGESLGELLSNMVGVSTLKTGQNVVKPVVHGLHSSRVLMINNGLRHANQKWGAEHAPEIDPSLAENITLIKGAASIKYGPEALGGVVVINAPRPELDKDLDAELELSAQTNGRAVGTSLFLEQGGKQFAWNAQASGLYQGDLHAPDYQLTNTGARELSFSFASRYHQRNFDVDLYYNYFDQELGILRGSVVGNLDDLAHAMSHEPPAYTSPFSYQINTPRQEVNHQLLKLSGNYNFSGSSLLLQYGLQYNHRQELDIRRGTNNGVPSLNLELVTHTIDTEWKHPSFGHWKGSVGAQLLYQFNNNIPGTNTAPFIPNFENTNLSLFVVEATEIGRFTTEVGLRYDAWYSNIRGRDADKSTFSNELSYHNLSGSVGIFTPLGEHAAFRSNLGTAWRPPNISELYSYGKHEFIIEYGLWRHNGETTGVFTEADRPVESEIGTKWINTYTWHKDKTALEVSGYANYLQHFIYARAAGITTTIRGAFPFFVYDQTNAFIMGLDASLVQEHNKSWQSQLKGSLLYARDLVNDQYFTGIAPNRLSYLLRYKNKQLSFMNNFSAGLETSYTFRQYQAPPVITIEEIQEAEARETELFAPGSQNFDFVAPPQGYFLASSYLAFSEGNFAFRLQARNILNTEYRSYTNRQRYFADELGRNFMFSVKYTL